MDIKHVCIRNGSGKKNNDMDIITLLHSEGHGNGLSHKNIQAVTEKKTIKESSLEGFDKGRRQMPRKTQTRSCVERTPQTYILNPHMNIRSNCQCKQLLQPKGHQHCFKLWITGPIPTLARSATHTPLNTSQSTSIQPSDRRLLKGGGRLRPTPMRPPMSLSTPRPSSPLPSLLPPLTRGNGRTNRWPAARRATGRWPRSPRQSCNSPAGRTRTRAS